MRDAIGHVFKFQRRQAIKILKNAVFQNLAVQGRNAVYAMAGGHAQVCHTHYAVGDNRHTLHPIRIPGRAPDEGAKTVVNLFGNLIDARIIR